jgi:hypothetical protein
MTTTTQTKAIAMLFPAAVYGGRAARALDALAALEACVRADVLRGPVAPESAPLVRPHAGSLYEADTLTWRFYHTNAGCVVHAICKEAYGTALARALYANLIFDLEETDEANHETEADAAYLILMRAAPPSLDRVRAALLSLRRTLRELCCASPGDPHCYYCYRDLAACAFWGFKVEIIKNNRHIVYADAK